MSTHDPSSTHWSCMEVVTDSPRDTEVTFSPPLDSPGCTHLRSFTGPWLVTTPLATGERFVGGGDSPYCQPPSSPRNRAGYWPMIPPPRQKLSPLNLVGAGVGGHISEFFPERKLIFMVYEINQHFLSNTPSSQGAGGNKTS